MVEKNIDNFFFESICDFLGRLNLVGDGGNIGNTAPRNVYPLGSGIEGHVAASLLPPRRV